MFNRLHITFLAFTLGCLIEAVVAASSLAFVSMKRSSFKCPTRMKRPFVCSTSAGDDNNIIEYMKNFSHSLQEISREINIVKENMNTMNNSINNSFEEMRCDMRAMNSSIHSMNSSIHSMNSSIHSELKAVNKSIGRLSNSVGLLHEESARNKAVTKFGAEFVKKLYAESIHDVVGVVLEERDDPRNLFEASEIVAKEAAMSLIPVTKALQRTLIIPENITGKNVQAAARKIKDARKKLDFFSGDEDPFLVDTSDLFDAVELLNNASSVFNRTVLKKYFEKIHMSFTKEKGLDLRKLLYSKGPGIFLLEYISRENHPTNFTSEPLPLIAIDYDMRGRVDVYDDHASVSVGEAKSSALQLRKAKKQCILRARVMEKTVGILFPKTKNIQKVGHVFIYDGRNITKTSFLHKDVLFQIHI